MLRYTYLASRIYEYALIGFLILLNSVDFDYNKLSNSLEDLLTVLNVIPTRPKYVDKKYIYNPLKCVACWLFYLIKLVYRVKCIRTLRRPLIQARGRFV